MHKLIVLLLLLLLILAWLLDAELELSHLLEHFLSRFVLVLDQKHEGFVCTRLHLLSVESLSFVRLVFLLRRIKGYLDLAVLVIIEKPADFLGAVVLVVPNLEESL